MYCKTCGNKIPEGMHFCTNCGTKVDDVPIVETPKVETPVVMTPDYAVPEMTESKKRREKASKKEKAPKKEKTPKKEKALKEKGGKAKFWIFFAIFLVIAGGAIAVGVLQLPYTKWNIWWHIAVICGLGLVALSCLVGAVIMFCSALKKEKHTDFLPPVEPIPPVPPTRVFEVKESATRADEVFAEAVSETRIEKTYDSVEQKEFSESTYRPEAAVPFEKEHAFVSTDATVSPEATISLNPYMSETTVAAAEAPVEPVETPVAAAETPVMPMTTPSTAYTAAPETPAPIAPMLSATPPSYTPPTPPSYTPPAPPPYTPPAAPVRPTPYVAPTSYAEPTYTPPPTYVAPPAPAAPPMPVAPPVVAPPPAESRLRIHMKKSAGESAPPMSDKFKPAGDL